MFRVEVPPEHVEQFPDTNKRCNFASCWIYEYSGILLGVHPIRHIRRIRVNETKSLVTSEDVHSHISKTNRAFVQLYPVWRNENFLVGNKIWLFNSNVKSFISYEREKCQITNVISNSFQVFLNRRLQCILKVKWPDKILQEFWQRKEQTTIGTTNKGKKIASDWP
jgi:hypothetical protein